MLLTFDFENGWVYWMKLSVGDCKVAIFENLMSGYVRNTKNM